jgi:hypothetical protein
MPCFLARTAPAAVRLRLPYAGAQRAAGAPVSEWLRDIAVELVFPLFCLLLGFGVAPARLARTLGYSVIVKLPA